MNQSFYIVSDRQGGILCYPASIVAKAELNIESEDVKKKYDVYKGVLSMKDVVSPSHEVIAKTMCRVQMPDGSFGMSDVLPYKFALLSVVCTGVDFGDFIQIKSTDSLPLEELNTLPVSVAYCLAEMAMEHSYRGSMNEDFLFTASAKPKPLVADK